jgi:hypothetical protein
MEELFVIFPIFLNELLGKCFTRSERCCVAGMDVILSLCTDGCGCGRRGRAVRPDVVYLTVETESDAAWIDEEIELRVSEQLHPIEPLDVGGSARRPDWVWGETRGREGNASEGRATNRVIWVPRGGVVRGEIGIEGCL